MHASRHNQIAQWRGKFALNKKKINDKKNLIKYLKRFTMWVKGGRGFWELQEQPSSSPLNTKFIPHLSALKDFLASFAIFLCVCWGKYRKVCGWLLETEEMRWGRKHTNRWQCGFRAFMRKDFLFVMSVSTSFLNFEVQNFPRRMNQLKSFLLLDYGWEPIKRY